MSLVSKQHSDMYRVNIVSSGVLFAHKPRTLSVRTNSLCIKATLLKNKHILAPRSKELRWINVCSLLCVDLYMYLE